MENLNFSGKVGLCKPQKSTLGRGFSTGLPKMTYDQIKKQALIQKQKQDAEKYSIKANAIISANTQFSNLSGDFDIKELTEFTVFATETFYEKEHRTLNFLHPEYVKTRISKNPNMPVPEPFMLSTFEQNIKKATTFYVDASDDDDVQNDQNDHGAMDIDDFVEVQPSNEQEQKNKNYGLALKNGFDVDVVVQVVIDIKNKDQKMEQKDLGTFIVFGKSTLLLEKLQNQPLPCFVSAHVVYEKVYAPLIIVNGSLDAWDPRSSSLRTIENLVFIGQEGQNIKNMYTAAREAVLAEEKECQKITHFSRGCGNLEFNKLRNLKDKLVDALNVIKGLYYRNFLLFVDLDPIVDITFSNSQEQEETSLTSTRTVHIVF